MKKEKYHNYFTALTFIFFFEGIQHSILYPINPFILKSNINSSNVMQMNQTMQDSQIVEVNQWKGQLSYYYGIYMLIFYVSQTIGMLFWSTKITQTNIKQCLVIMIFVQATATIGVSLNLSLISVFMARAIQGLFSCSVGIVKLTIDNKFSPSRDMQKVVDFTGLWFLGLAIGTSLTSILHYTVQTKELINLTMFETHPYLFAALMNAILQICSAFIIVMIYPQFSPKKKQYKKMQSTLFFQSVFFLSQNDYTWQVTRHQRTRSTFDRMLLKQILWQDRNFLFALVHQGLVYFVFMGFFDVFCVYCVTVLNIQNELYLSNIYCLCIFAIFIYEMFGVDVNYFEQRDQPRTSNKDLLGSLIIGLIALSCLYLLRFLVSINTYIFLVLISIAFMFYSINACKIIAQSHYLVEQTALQCGDDADHARNLAQLNANFSKIFGVFILSLCSAFNFWQYTIQTFDFMYVYILIVILLSIIYLIVNCLDQKWKEPDTYDSYQSTQVYNQDLSKSKNEIFA